MPTHHLVLWCAIDGLDLAALLLGVDEVIESGEKFPIVPPIPADQARQATLELLDAGAIRVAFFDRHSGESRWLDLEKARATLSEPATWDLSVPAPAAYSYETHLTPAGDDMFAEARREFGHEMDRSMENARERSAEFLRRHPDFVERNAKYLDELTRWVETGEGPELKRPQFE